VAGLFPEGVFNQYGGMLVKPAKHPDVKRSPAKNSLIG
jgi:hypothetical protein